MSAPAYEHVASYHGLLGTVVEIRVTAAGAGPAAEAEQQVVAEIQRLESVFSVYDRGSTLSRWRQGDLDAAGPGPELGPVLALALGWQARSGGAFNPLTGLITRCWRAAAEAGVPPAEAELDELAAAVARPPYRIGPTGPERTGSCQGLDLNALAKGWIVDRALDVGAAVTEVGAVVVNAGGDLARRGPGSILVGVENPLRPYDNEPPLALVELAGGAALATTGGARRGVTIAGTWYSHVLDPRTARPVAHTASATVLAPDAATADVVATVAGVLPPAEALAFVDALDATVSCLLVTPDGTLHPSRHWPPPPPPSSAPLRYSF